MQHICLPPRCDRQAIVGLIDPIAAALAEGPVTIDARETARAGQALLQLLLSARRTAEAHGTSCTILPSAALRDIGALTGTDTLLFDEAQA